MDTQLASVMWDSIGCSIRPEPLDESAYYTISNVNDPLTAQGVLRRCMDLQAWMSNLPEDEEDFELYGRTMSAAFGVSMSYCASAAFALLRLKELPATNAIFRRLYHLDIDRLIGINNTLDKLGPSPDPGSLHRIDLELAEYITPTKKNQRMPSRRSIVKFLNEMLAVEDSTLNLEGKSNRLRYVINYSGERAFIELEIGSEAGAVIDSCIRELAERTGVSLAQAAIQLLTGEENPQAKLILNLYSAKDVENTPVFIPGIGWLEGKDLLERVSTTRDMDQAATAETQSYSPTDAIRSAVVGMDGTCRWPGCEKSAHRSQTDHRHNHSEGGPTAPWNLASLCQHHHNVKTDRRAFYIMDPVTRDVYWLFPDGTWESTVATGPMSEGNKRWVQTYAQASAARRKRAQDFARIDAVVLPPVDFEDTDNYDDEEPPF